MNLTGAQLSLVYNLPLYAMVVLWAFCRWKHWRSVTKGAVLLDVIVILTAGSRYFGPLIPASGHALFLSYSLCSIPNRMYKIFAAILLAGTVLLKLSWGDYFSWLYGILLGLGLGMMQNRVAQRE